MASGVVPADSSLEQAQPQEAMVPEDLEVLEETALEVSSMCLFFSFKSVIQH